jgi:hypothetical protein
LLSIYDVLLEESLKKRLLIWSTDAPFVKGCSRLGML